MEKVRIRDFQRAFTCSTLEVSANGKRKKLITLKALCNHCGTEIIVTDNFKKSAKRIREKKMWDHFHNCAKRKSKLSDS